MKIQTYIHSKKNVCPIFNRIFIYKKGQVYTFLFDFFSSISLIFGRHQDKVPYILYLTNTGELSVLVPDTTVEIQTPASVQIWK